jgi:hypothetical protein
MHELYLKIVPVHGVIMDFGTRWGQNLALFSSFRGIYEPYNYNRKLVGFDTFSGFPSHAPQDGSDAAIQPGAYGVTPGYESSIWPNCSPPMGRKARWIISSSMS